MKAKTPFFRGPLHPIAVLCTSGLFGLAGARADLTLHYNFEGVTNVETDAVPNLGSFGSNGAFINPEKLSLISGTVVSVGEGRYLLGKSVNFVNADSETSTAGHVDTGAAPEDFGMTTGFEWSRDYTAMAWVNFGSTVGDNMVFGQLAGEQSIHLGSRNGFFHSGHWGDDIGPDQSVNVPTGTGEWHHVAFVNEGQAQSIFRDGVLVAGPGADAISGNPNAGDNLLIGTFTNNGSFIGAIDEVKVFGDQAMTAAEIQAEMIAGLPLYVLASVTRASLSNSGYRFELTDAEGSAVNPGSIVLTIDGSPVTPVVAKDGAVTTVTYTPPSPLPPGALSSYGLVAKDGANEDVGNAGSVRMPYLPVSLPGPAGTVGSWGMREYKAPGTFGGDSLEFVVGELAALPDSDPGNPDIIDVASVPVVNHSDPDAPGGRGNFNNDLPTIGNLDGTGDDYFAIVAKTQITITDTSQDYTFAIHSDDGFALRINGGPDGNTSRFVTSSGNGSIDGSDPQSLLHVAPTGDSNTRGVYRFSDPGTYDVLFVGYEIGGGAFFEVAWAPGSHAATRDTTWSLVGNPSDPAVTAVPFLPRWLTELPGPAGTAGNWGIRTFLQADAVDNLTQTMEFLEFSGRTPENDPDFTSDAQRPYLNFIDPDTNGVAGNIAGDEPFPGNQEGTDDDRVVTVAKGRIQVTTAGDYTMSVRGDDGFLLRLKGVDAPNPAFKRVSRANLADANGRFEMSNPNEMFYEAGTGDSDTRGIINLPVGLYDVEFVHWEGGGGFFIEVAVAVGSHPHGGGTTPVWRPLGYAPEPGPLAVPGIADPGWTVESSTPDRPEFTPDLFGAEAAIDATIADPGAPAAKTSVWDAVNFTDPEAGADGSYVPNNIWPLNTAGDDNNYAMRATASLVIETAGVYHLGFQGDDGGSIIIEGPGNPEWSEIVFTNHPDNAIIGEAVGGSGINNAIFVDVPTGNSRTIGAITLQPGTYTLKSVMYEIGGGSWWELMGLQAAGDFVALPLLAKGAPSTLTDPTGLPLVGDTTPPPTAFFITNVTATGNPITTVNLTFPSEAGVTYTVQASPGTGPWSNAGTVLATGAETTTSVALSGVPGLEGASRAFFRVVKP